MDLINSQESEIINEGDLNYIMNDLGPSQQLMFLQEYSDDIYNSNCTQQQQHQQQQLNVDEGVGHVEMLPPPPPAPPPVNHSSPTGIQPCLTKYPGVYNFQVNLAVTPNGRHAWVYSSKLQKVFIDKDKVLLLQFRLNTVEVKGLCVRALLVYTDADHAMIAVDRCTLHLFHSDPNRQAHTIVNRVSVCECVRYQQCGHVVTSDHPGAEYQFNAASGRHSVLVPLLPQGAVAGQDATTVAYQFGCKTSCPAGMSRRPVALVFTLETQFGEVLGRSTMPIKICSCPKRDKDREESGEYVGGDAPLDRPTKQPLLTNTNNNSNSTTSKKRKLVNQQHQSQQQQHKSPAVTASAADPPTKDTNQQPAIAMLFDEVQKLNAKFDQLNSKVEELLGYFRENRPRPRD